MVINDDLNDEMRGWLNDHQLPKDGNLKSVVSQLMTEFDLSKFNAGLTIYDWIQTEESMEPGELAEAQDDFDDGLDKAEQRRKDIAVEKQRLMEEGFDADDVKEVLGEMDAYWFGDILRDWRMKNYTGIGAAITVNLDTACATLAEQTVDRRAK